LTLGIPDAELTAQVKTDITVGVPYNGNTNGESVKISPVAMARLILTELVRNAGALNENWNVKPPSALNRSVSIVTAGEIIGSLKSEAEPAVGKLFESRTVTVHVTDFPSRAIGNWLNESTHESVDALEGKPRTTIVLGLAATSKCDAASVKCTSKLGVETTGALTKNKNEDPSLVKREPRLKPPADVVGGSKSDASPSVGPLSSLTDRIQINSSPTLTIEPPLTEPKQFRFEAMDGYP